MPAKDSPQPGKTESSVESQKPNHTVEITHKELRSREVKTSVSISHPEPESFQADPGKESLSASDEASSNAKTASVTQEESTPTAKKVVEPLTVTVDEKVQESKTNIPTSPQESSPKGKDTIESESVKVEGVVPQVSEVTTESLKRKLSSEQEVAEKKPRVAEGSPPPPTEGLPPATPSVTASQRVPPLKVGFTFTSYSHFCFIAFECSFFWMLKLFQNVSRSLCHESCLPPELQAKCLQGHLIP